MGDDWPEIILQIESKPWDNLRDVVELLQLVGKVFVIKWVWDFGLFVLMDEFFNALQLVHRHFNI